MKLAQMLVLLTLLLALLLLLLLLLLRMLLGARALRPFRRPCRRLPPPLAQNGRLARSGSLAALLAVKLGAKATFAVEVPEGGGHVHRR